MKSLTTLTALSMILAMPLLAVGDEDLKDFTTPAARAKVVQDSSSEANRHGVVHEKSATDYAMDIIYIMTGWNGAEFERLPVERLRGLMAHAPLIFPSQGQHDAATFEEVKSLVGLSVEQMETLYGLRDAYFKEGSVPPSTTAGLPRTITTPHKDRAEIIRALASKTPEQMRIYGEAVQQGFEDFPIVEYGEHLWAKLVGKLLSKNADDIPSYVEALTGHKEKLFPKRPNQTNLCQYVHEWYDVMMCLLDKAPEEVENLGNVMKAPPFNFEWRTGTYYDEEVVRSLRMALYTKTSTELETFVTIMQGVPSFLTGDPLSRLHHLVKYPLDDVKSFVTLIQTESAALASKMKDSADYKECPLEATQDDLKCRLLYTLDSIPLVESQRILGELQSQSWMNDSTYSPRLRDVFLDFICKQVSTTKDRIDVQKREAERKAINDQKEKAKPVSGATTSGE